MYYFIDDGTDMDPSGCESEICSEDSHSLEVDDGGQISSGSTSRSLSSTSKTCNGAYYSAGIINQPTNRELLSKIENIRIW